MVMKIGTLAWHELACLCAVLVEDFRRMGRKHPRCSCGIMKKDYSPPVFVPSNFTCAGSAAASRLIVRTEPSRKSVAKFRGRAFS